MIARDYLKFNSKSERLDEAAYQAFLLRSEETYALERVGTVEDTARAIAFWLQTKHRRSLQA